MGPLILLIIVLVCLILSALFSASETSITAVSDAAIHKLKSDGNKKAKRVEELKKDRENLISTILIANNALNIIASSVAAAVALKLFGDEGLVYATIFMTIIIILFSEVLPKTYAIENTERVALEVGGFLSVAVKLFKPVTNSMKYCVRLIFNIFGIKHSSNGPIVTAIDELRGTIDLHHSEGRVVRADKEMLGSILDLSVIEVKEIMVHRRNIVSVDIDLTIEDIIEQVLASGHTRIPLWQGNPENIVAVLHTKDLFRVLKLIQSDVNSLDILTITSKPWFIHETTDLKSQLAEFRIKRNHCALVIDEYGALEGFITLADILEEIVGRIEDEHKDSNDIKITHTGACEVKGSVSIRDLNRALDWHLPDDEASTIAGLLIFDAERIPDINEVFVFHEIKFTVLEKTRNQILKLKLERVQQDN